MTGIIDLSLDKYFSGIQKRFKSVASEILNKKRKLSLEMIRQLHERLHIPTDVLIQTY